MRDGKKMSYTKRGAAKASAPAVSYASRAVNLARPAGFLNCSDAKKKTAASTALDRIPVNPYVIKCGSSLNGQRLTEFRLNMAELRLERACQPATRLGWVAAACPSGAWLVRSRNVSRERRIGA